MFVSVTNLQKKIPLNHLKIKQQVNKILRKRKIKVNEISVVFVDAKTIKRLNKKFFHHSHLTDVLSFDNSFKENLLWEIIISTDAAIKNAKKFKTSIEFELELYLIHGILHLLGYDDSTSKKRRIMRQAEAAFL